MIYVNIKGPQGSGKSRAAEMLGNFFLSEGKSVKVIEDEGTHFRHAPLRSSPSGKAPVGVIIRVKQKD